MEKGVEPAVGIGKVGLKKGGCTYRRYCQGGGKDKGVIPTVNIVKV